MFLTLQKDELGGRSAVKPLNVNNKNISERLKLRNRLKLKHENKLQKEFFERKRQQKSSTRAAVPKRMDKMKGRGSQDLFSLEVIMSAHRNEKKRGADGTSSWKNGKVDHENSKVKSFPTRHLEHIIPELSPVRPQLPVHVQQVQKHDNFCLNQGNRDCVYSNESLRRKMDDETLVVRQFVSNEEGIPWETASTTSTFEHRASHSK